MEEANVLWYACQFKTVVMIDQMLLTLRGRRLLEEQRGIFSSIASSSRD
jgi:hypothetical protein